MEREAGKKQGDSAAEARAARLKAALKANIARRKLQARARAAGGPEGGAGGGPEGGTGGGPAPGDDRERQDGRGD